MQSTASIFITGNSRSGTTMMSRIMANHADVFSFQELHFFDEILSSQNISKKINQSEAKRILGQLTAIQRNGYFGSRNYDSFSDEVNAIANEYSPKTYGEVYTAFLHYETEKNNKKISCEQTPQNIFFLNEILSLIPNAKIIVMVRDPRSVLLSQKNKWKRRALSGGQIPFMESVRSRINYHPFTISKIWNSVMRKALEFQNHPAVLIVKYENLIHEPEKTIQQICSHVNIDFNKNMLSIPVVGSSNFQDAKSARGIDKSKTDQWQSNLNTAEINICENINGELMNKFNYEISNKKASFLKLMIYKISLPISLGMAVMFNLKRLKNPGKIIKRFVG